MLKDSLHRSYMAECIGNIHDSTEYPKLRTNKLFKEEFQFENYLSSTKNLNHTLVVQIIYELCMYTCVCVSLCVCMCICVYM